MRNGLRHVVAIVLCAACPVSCATPAERYDEVASRLGLARQESAGLVVFRSRPASENARLHVYIEGDGLPRRAIRHLPPDPTPERVVALRLMRVDPAASILLGRPCHHAARICQTGHWTLGRYGEPVVAAMLAALRAQLAAQTIHEVVLIGFSGGGTLAMLIAERLPETVAVVTLAGNLDVGAWTDHHDYAPLEDSLDPARRPPLPPHVLQLHLLAGRDRITPPELVRASLGRQPAAQTRLYPDFDHDCCWERVWPGLLEELERRLQVIRTPADRPL